MATQPLYQLPSGDTYLYLFDQYCPFQDAATQQAVCGSSPAIEKVNALPNGGTPGAPILDGSCMWQESGNPAIFLLMVSKTPQGQTQAGKFLVSDPVSLQYYQLLAPVQESSGPLATWILATPSGANISAPS